jgi:1,4-dihydroxy-2-naphthoate octaprenyltransferase
VNKRTLAVIFGREGARIEYKLLLIACYVSQVILILLGWMPITTLLTLITIPEARRLAQVFDTETETAKLHAAQGGTAKLHGRIGLLMVLGWLLWLIGQSLLVR